MDQLRYEAPVSLDQAIGLLSSANGREPCVLAGGTDLIIQMRAGLREPGLVIDVKRIAELMTVSSGKEGLRIGAAVPAAELTEHLELKQAYPGLAEAIGLIGSTQIQGRCSLGGNLCNASPAADSVPALIALGAECVILGPKGGRMLAVADFVTGPGTTALGPSELLVELVIPPAGKRSADAYLRFIPRTEMDIAVAGSAVSLSLDSSGRCQAARVVLGAVAPTAILVPDAADALVGTSVDEAALARAGEAASAACNPIDDKRGTAEYRRKISAVMTRRAGAIAANRARRRS